MTEITQPLVTVGLAVFNGEKNLPYAIECWLNQDFQNIELVISDNGSTDRTMEICKEYQLKDKRIRYFRFPENMGRGRTFGRLAECARGKYFVYAFHNDYFTPNYLSACLEVLENDPSVVLCYSGAYIMDDNRRPSVDISDKFKLNHEFVGNRYESLLKNLDLCTCFHGLARTNDVLHVLPFNLCAAGDVCYLAKLIMRGKFARIEAPLCWREKPAHLEQKTMTERYKYFDRVGIPHLPYTDYNALPFIDFITILVDHICGTPLDDETKEILIKHTYTILFARYNSQIRWEIQNMVSFLHVGNVRHIWKEEPLSKKVEHHHHNLNRAYLMKRYQEVDRLLNFILEDADLYYITGCLLSSLGRFEEAKLRLEIALRIMPNHLPAGKLLQTLENMPAKRKTS